MTFIPRRGPNGPQPQNPIGRPPGIPRASNQGRKKGVLNKATQERHETLQVAVTDVFSRLTDDEINNITCLDVWQMCLVAAIRANAVVMALTIAKEYAPYKHAKLAPKLIDTDDNNVVQIVGGLPS